MFPKVVFRGNKTKAHIPLETGFALGTNANKINTKNMKCTWPTHDFCVGDPKQPIFHWLALGLCVRTNANFKFCVGGEGFALAPRYQHVGIPNAKFWRWGHCPTPTPDARYFASQWNIGFKQI